MILAIDIGNTNIVVGCIDEEKIYFTERLSTVRTKTELEYAVDLKTVLDIYHALFLQLCLRLQVLQNWQQRKF